MNFAPSRRTLALAAVLTLLTALGLAAGCSSLGYYAQSIQGHMALLDAARPIDDIVDGLVAADDTGNVLGHNDDETDMGASATTRAGTKPSKSPMASRPSRYARRHVFNCERESPYLRAVADARRGAE